MNLNTLDFVLLIPLLYGLARGLYRGLVGEITSLVGLVAGLLAAFYFFNTVFDLLAGYFHEPGIGLQILSFVLVFLAVALAINLIGKALSKALALIALGTLNRLLGAAFGLAKWILISSILIYFFDSLQKEALIVEQELLDNSTVYNKLLILSRYFAGLIGSSHTQARLTLV